MSMHRLIYPLCLCLLAASARAQVATVQYQRPTPVIVKLAPLWLIDRDPTVSAGLEVRTGRRTAVQGEFGYGWPGWRNPSATDEHTGTWRIKTELRVYRNRYRYRPVRHHVRIATAYPLGNYWAIESYAKLLHINHNWTYYNQTTNPSQPAVPGESRQSFIRRNSLSLTGKVGRQMFGRTGKAGRSKARLLWDVYAGAGVRLTNQTTVGESDDLNYRESFGGFFNRFRTNGFSVSPTVAVGLKVGFAL